MTSYEDETITTITNYAFSAVTSLRKIILNNVKIIGANAINGLANLEEVYIPNVTQIGSNAFQNCTNLEGIEIRSLTNFSGNSNFYGCQKLLYCDLGTVRGLPGSCFGNNYNLKYVFLRKTDGITSMDSYNVFNNTPLNGRNSMNGIVFVPSALIPTYQTATNWVGLYNAGTCIFKPLENYTKDGTVTGELNWEAINAEEV